MLGRRPLHRLAEPDLAHPVVPELRRVRVRPEVGDVEHRRLGAAQPEPVGHLSSAASRNAGSQPLRPPPRTRRDLLVGVVEQRLQLIEGERPLARVGLVLLDVHRGVPLMDHLDRVGAEPRLALAGPPVGRIGRIPAERRHRRGVGPDRRPPQPRTPRSSPSHSSSICGPHCHGNASACAANARTIASRRRPSTAPGSGPAAAPATLPASPRTPAHRDAAAARPPPGAARRPRRPVPPHPHHGHPPSLTSDEGIFHQMQAERNPAGSRPAQRGHFSGAIRKIRRTNQPGQLCVAGDQLPVRHRRQVAGNVTGSGRLDSRQEFKSAEARRRVISLVTPGVVAFARESDHCCHTVHWRNDSLGQR